MNQEQALRHLRNAYPGYVWAIECERRIGSRQRTTHYVWLGDTIAASDYNPLYPDDFANVVSQIPIQPDRFTGFDAIELAATE